MAEVDVDLHTLQQSVTYALEALRHQATVIEAEVCATWCEHQTVRLQYDSERSGRGVQPPQVQTTFGLGVLLVIEDQDGRRIGFGSDVDDLSPEGTRGRRSLFPWLTRAAGRADHPAHLLRPAGSGVARR